MTLPPNTNGRPSLTNRFLLKIVLFVLITILGARTVYDLSRPNTTVDLSEIDALVAEAHQQSLTQRGLELVEGPVHEASDPTRKCQGNSLAPLAFRGTATLNLKDDTKVVLTISDCHPCNWPVKSGEDISAYAQLDVKSSDNHSFSILAYMGGPEEHSPGSFRMLLPVNVQKRSRILQIIQEISEHGASPEREEFNLVLKEVLSSLHNSFSDTLALRLGALLCKSVDLSINSDKSP
ncbi:MAG TPA: hypothetical protein EYM79_11215 [Planctomycetes bacterium]|nr:hypothetical protein [Planctomycetaceae bacterium]HIN54872.1 hypothetical protein [Planctomycetota bacterium]